jgi:hypothetical protein
MEAEIGRFLGQSEIDGFSLRVVECRTSLCIAEVFSASPNVWLFGAELPNTILLGLSNLFLDGFPEVTETYGEGMVTLVIFQKR